MRPKGRLYWRLVVRLLSVMLLPIGYLEMPELKIIGWRPGLLKISMTAVLREHLPLSVKEAKGCVDSILDGQVVSFRLDGVDKAEALATALTEVGAIVEIESR